MTRRYLLGDHPVRSLDAWTAGGGGEGLVRATALGPSQTIKELGLAGLRGRGGAGFPTSRKWTSVREAGGSHRYAVCNAAEGEPATFKDRAILRANPYQVLEGLVIAALTVGAREAFIGIKARFELEHELLALALAEMQAADLAGDIPVVIVAGPDEYLFGEEKALLEVIEGHPPLPRLLPPYEHGLFASVPQSGWEPHDPEPGHRHIDESNPTLVNNVETLADVAHILARGAEWFRSMGTEESPGNVVVTVVGDVVHPGVEEIELGTPLVEVIETVGGGPRPGHMVKAVMPGVANPVVPSDMLDVPVAYETMQAAGSGMGAAGFAVYDETACMVEVARQYSRFLWVESCGQCPPCKLGTEAITARLDDIEACRGTDQDLGTISAELRRVADANRCYLPVQEELVVSSLLRSFPEEFAAHLEGVCPRPRGDLVAPLVKDLSDGQVVYDERQPLKRPDWTYENEPG